MPVNIAAKVFAPIKGTPPSIEWRALADLAVDESYQRSILGRESQAIVKAISRDWDWRLCAPIVVSRRLHGNAQPASQLFVIDGQHRLEAARIRGDIPFLPCIITTYATSAEEAELFVAVNQRRRRVSTLENFRAAIVAGDATCQEAAELIATAGLTVARNGSPDSWQPGDLGQVGTVVKGLRRFGRTPVAASLIQLAEAFPDERLDHAGRLLDGLFRIHSAPPPGFDGDRLFRALLIRNQPQWSAQAMAEIALSGVTWSLAMQSAMLQAYAETPADADIG